jgi:hemolysin activation/secretion protein
MQIITVASPALGPLRDPARAMSFGRRLGPLLVAVLGVSLSCESAAQTQPPSGGQLLQQLTLPPLPPPADKPALSIEKPDKARADSSVAISVKQIRITGNESLPTPQLHALVASAEGTTQTLGDLQGLADRITQFYRLHGYPLARAYVPAQTIAAGEVTLAVLEAKYGQVALNNASTTSERPLADTLAPLESGKLVTQDTLDRALLLLSDIPGVIVNSTIRPGATTGTSDLQVDVTSAARYSGLASLDDFGNRYTGRTRGSAIFNVNSLLHQGDKLDLDLLTSGSGMSYGQLGYHYLLNGQGTTVGVATSYLHYQLSGALSDLRAHGTAQVDTLSLSQPFVRSTVGNLYVQLQFDHKQLHDDIDLASIRSNRHTNGLTAVLAGDRRDDYGITNFNFSATVDHVTFDDYAARISDQLGAETEGSHAHYQLTLARLQQLDPSNALYFALTGQSANGNLDPADQFYLGGPSNARGFDTGALTGSQGYLLTAEWRHALPLPFSGAWLGSIFVDHGRIQVYEHAFTSGENVGSLSDVGVALHWDGSHEWAVSAQVATRFGPSSPLLTTDPGTRGWIQVQKGF